MNIIYRLVTNSVMLCIIMSSCMCATTQGDLIKVIKRVADQDFNVIRSNCPLPPPVPKSSESYKRWELQCNLSYHILHGIHFEYASSMELDESTYIPKLKQVIYEMVGRGTGLLPTGKQRFFKLDISHCSSKPTVPYGSDGSRMAYNCIEVIMPEGWNIDTNPSTIYFCSSGTLEGGTQSSSSLLHPSQTPLCSTPSRLFSSLGQQSGSISTSSSQGATHQSSGEALLPTPTSGLTQAKPLVQQQPRSSATTGAMGSTLRSTAKTFVPKQKSQIGTSSPIHSDSGQRGLALAASTSLASHLMQPPQQQYPSPYTTHQQYPQHVQYPAQTMHHTMPPAPYSTSTPLSSSGFSLLLGSGGVSGPSSSPQSTGVSQSTLSGAAVPFVSRQLLTQSSSSPQLPQQQQQTLIPAPPGAASQPTQHDSAASSVVVPPSSPKPSSKQPAAKPEAAVRHQTEPTS